MQAASHQVAADVQIVLDASNTLILKNVAVANLGADDFHFH